MTRRQTECTTNEGIESCPKLSRHHLPAQGSITIEILGRLAIAVRKTTTVDEGEHEGRVR